MAGVYLEEFLVRVLASSLRGYVCYGTFKDLQQCLLHTLARHVSSDRWVFVLAANFVDLVDINDAALTLFDVSAGGLKQLEDDVFHVLTDIASLS